MATRGFLIRFIDIGLIVLFGFLMISDIDTSSRVELASVGSEIEEPSVLEENRAFIVVEITETSFFRVSEPAVPERDPVTVANVDALIEALRVLQRIHTDERLETVVLIQPDPASVVQATVDAMDACDRLGLAKSLRMDIELAPAPDAEAPIAEEEIGLLGEVAR